MDTLTFEISSHHPAFAGHFPGTPVLPGAVLLDETVRLLAAAAHKDECVCRIMSAKFLGFVRPGESLSIEHERRADGSVCFVIRTADRTVGSGTLAWLPAEGRAPREA